MGELLTGEVTPETISEEDLVRLKRIAEHAIAPALVADPRLHSIFGNGVTRHASIQEDEGFIVDVIYDEPARDSIRLAGRLVRTHSGSIDVEILQGIYTYQEADFAELEAAFFAEDWKGA